MINPEPVEFVRQLAVGRSGNGDLKPARHNHGHRGQHRALAAQERRVLTEDEQPRHMAGPASRAGAGALSDRSAAGTTSDYSNPYSDRVFLSFTIPASS